MTGSPAGFKPVGYQNINGLLAGVVYKGACTLHELKTVYSLYDVKWLEECFYVPDLNDARIRERERRRSDMRNVCK